MRQERQEPVNTQIKKAFEAMMRGNGYDENDLMFEGKTYVKPAIQIRWRFFLMGWEMANFAKEKS